jgi:hypothetical protein
VNFLAQSDTLALGTLSTKWQARFPRIIDKEGIICCNIHIAIDIIQILSYASNVIVYVILNATSYFSNNIGL